MRCQDAVSGGTQIQSVALEQSGGVPTNRIQYTPPSTNVTLAANGATATASSTTPDSEFPGMEFHASSVNDGNRSGNNYPHNAFWRDGTDGAWPDWVQVDFNGSKTINEIDVFTVQDTIESGPTEPTEAMTFSLHGITDFTVQSWNGSSWQTVPGGSVTGNDKVWRKFTFSDITTDKIRVYVTGALNSRSRVVEMEAYQSTATYTYDAAGNVINDGAHTYTYDAENRLVSVDGGATGQYAYDPSNRRYKKVAGGATTHYIWQGSQVIAEYDGSTGALTAEYVYSGSRMIAKVASGTTQYFLSDRLSTRLVLDATGNVLGRMAHFPFGEDFGESGTQEKRHFTSYERDSESGTDYAVNRQYSQGVGRFSRPDPYRGSCKTVTPKSLNRYAYVANDPINSVDPLGLIAYCPPECFDPETGECNCPSTSGEPPSFEVPTHDWFTIEINPGGNTNEGGNSCEWNGPGEDSTPDSPEHKWRVYDCKRPLNKPGSAETCSGPLCHEYLCVQGKRGNMKCVGLSPSSSGEGSGENNSADGYHTENCKEVASDSCMAKCVKNRFNKTMPNYAWHGIGAAMNCQGWASDVLTGCLKECGAK